VFIRSIQTDDKITQDHRTYARTHTGRLLQ